MELHTAASRGDDARLVTLLHEGAAPDAPRTRDGLTALMLAASSPRTTAETLRILLAAGSDPSGRPGAATSPLALAATDGDPGKVRILLEAGALTAEPASPTPIAVHAAYGPLATRITVLTLLIEAGADLNAAGAYGETAIAACSLACDFDAVRYLLARGADPAPLGWDPLMRAAALGTVVEARDALGFGAAAGARDHAGRTALLIAAARGDTAMAAALHDGASPIARGDDGATALFWAVRGRHAPMCRWLLERGEDPGARDAWRCTPLMAAAAEGAHGCMEALLAAGADPAAADRSGATALAHAADLAAAVLLLDALPATPACAAELPALLVDAAGCGDAALVAELLRRGVPHRTEGAGDTPLHAAAGDDHVEIVHLLLAAGADPDAANADGETPLASAQSRECVEALAAAGASVDAMDIAGRTPLGRADDPDVVAALLRAGASVRPRSRAAVPVLLGPAQSGSAACVCALIAAGADVEAAAWGETPLMAAAERGHDACIRALLDAGAAPDRRDAAGRTALHRAAAPEVFPAQQVRAALRGLHAQQLVVREIEAMLPEGSDAAQMVREALQSDLPGAGASDAVEAIASLLEGGASVDARDRRGITPLMLAARHGRASRVIALLARGASTRKRDLFLRSAADHARAHADPEHRSAILAALAQSRTRG